MMSADGGCGNEAPLAFARGSEPGSNASVGSRDREGGRGNDDAVRNRIVTESGRSFVVEASAGTGKTTLLISRILDLVLRKDLPLRNICAITFTEKAAGEMKIRLRQEFEKAAAVEATETRARQALSDLESASISTFHALAVALLKERPIEAKVDPRFSAMADVQSGLFFNDVWESWIGEALTKRCPQLEAALRGGLTLEDLRSIAQALRAHSSVLPGVDLFQPVSEQEVRARKLELLHRARQYVKSCRESQDKLLASLTESLDWLAGRDDVKPGKAGNFGSARNWDGDADTVASVREFVAGVSEFAAAVRLLPCERLMCQIVGWVRDDFFPLWQRQKRLQGFLDFDDQLAFACDLLKSSRAARRDFQSRFKTLLVDEFQDTDPIQLELVLLLCCTDLDERDPARMKPAPGRVFIVGDPKQSIYRFRGADIETYLGFVPEDDAHSRNLEWLEITTNFRSVPSILRFVDSAFSGIMHTPGDGKYQSEYLPFGACARETEPDAPSVYLLGDRDEGGGLAGSGKGYVAAESSRLARLILKIRGGESWKVADPDSHTWRNPTYGDIAVLLPALTYSNILEDEFRTANIPYVLEGGKFYYARSEVASALTLLKAISNPNDRVALYGGLRSIFFGISDEDLLRARAEGVHLDYRVPPGPASPLRRPFEILLELHNQRLNRPPSETFELLLRQTGAREVLAARGLQSIANLDKLSRTLRSLQPGRTFSAVVDCLSAIDEEGTAEAESRVMEERSDAVRVLSIHKAKGLDFPIVIVAGMGMERKTSAGKFLADVHQTRRFAIKCGERYTPGWKDLSEHNRKREDQELIRLLYVALTRARDHLILSTHHCGKRCAEENSRDADFKRTRLQPIAEFLAQAAEDTTLARFLDGKEVDRWPAAAISAASTGRRDWIATLDREAAELDALLSATPQSKLLRAAGHPSPDDSSEASIPEAMQDRAIRLGLAYHEAMAAADLGKGSEIPLRAREAALRHDIDEENLKRLEQLLNCTFVSPLIERAREAIRSGRTVWRELPFVRRNQESGAIEEGKIDLLFEEDGGWVLVDYKTEAVPRRAEQLKEKYAAQIGAYLAAAADLGITVKSAYLLLARTGDSVELPQ